MKRILILASLLFCCVTQAEVKFHYDTSYYSFDANDIESMVEKVRDKGPKIGTKAAWAIIKWDLNTVYSFRSTEKGCNIIVDNMELVANVTLPKWQDVINKRTEIKNWWRDYTAFITQHENLHFESALASANIFENSF
jgi:predicted secreted Zn-dependent protease